ncbi:TonB-dependent receptor [Chitinophaga sp. Cy-1792]|uniref:SusC/RagA family TonB-linked outer membrane protein n=1 Tax=Chitinophaga sp. Cy-1792 TaxID=2608339 RepID=UPI001F03B2BC|nr:TonB-dependent receptor [Chitinophaga sp. Cy-1792]
MPQAKKLQCLLSLLLLSSTAMQVSAQSRVISGSVKDEKNYPLQGVTVKVKNSPSGATTDAKGNFTFNANGNADSLIVTFIGYNRQSLSMAASNNFSIILQQASTSLTDVVVVGYGQQKKESVTAAISTISSKELVQSPVANISNALAGRLSGLTAIQTSGKPGADASTLYVRGVGTYTGNTAPLVMVDGVARDSYNDIDPNEIETLSILKDASATAVYGVRGANGVILITTKRGKTGTPRISASAQTAYSEFNKMPNFVNSYQYATLKNEQTFENYWVQYGKGYTDWSQFVKDRDANWTTSGGLYFSPEDIKYYQNAHTPAIDGKPNPYYDPYFHPDVNWKDQIFRKTAPQKQVNANVTGGTNAVKYFLSFGYLNQGGLFNTSFMPFSDEMQFKKNRYNLRGNFDFDVNKDFKISLDLGTQYIQLTGMDNDQYIWEKRILWASPLSSPGYKDGKFLIPYTQTTNDQTNPLYAIANSNNYNLTNNSTLNSSLKLSYKLDFITPGLSVNARGAYDSYFSSRTGGKSYPLLYNFRPNPNGDKLNPIIYLVNDIKPNERWADWYNEKNRKIYTEFSINYARDFGKHAVTGLLLGNTEKFFNPKLVPDLPHAYVGMAGRVTYGYAGKYLAEFNMGYNGSENFPKGQRYGFLPAVSAGWVASNENFFPKNDLLTYLKFRGSLGKVGNDKITIPGTTIEARYLYLPDAWNYSSSQIYDGYFYGTQTDRNYVMGAIESALGNPNVTWETSTKGNIGFEARLWKDKITVTFDHFNEKRINILSYKGTVPAVMAATLPPYNIGSVRNWGNELEVGYNDRVGKVDFWVKGNISNNKNEILFQDEAITPGLEYQAATGRPINQGLWLQSSGLYTSWSELYEVDGSGNPILTKPVAAKNKMGKSYTNASGNVVYQKDLGYGGAMLQPGEVRLIDYNEDGVIDQKDFVRSGATNIPTISYGFSFGFSYAGFDFSALIQGVSGTARNAMYSTSPHFNKQEALFDVDLNRFTEERYKNGEKIDFPIAGYNMAAKNNTFFMINTAYTRLKNMEIGYTVKASLLKRIGISSARIYANGNNLITWCPKPIWGDPENLNYVGYPLTRTYNMGLNVNF